MPANKIARNKHNDEELELLLNIFEGTMDTQLYNRKKKSLVPLVTMHSFYQFINVGPLNYFKPIILHALLSCINFLGKWYGKNLE